MRRRVLLRSGRNRRRQVRGLGLRRPCQRCRMRRARPRAGTVPPAAGCSRDSIAIRAKSAWSIARSRWYRDARGIRLPPGLPAGDPASSPRWGSPSEQQRRIGASGPPERSGWRHVAVRSCRSSVRVPDQGMRDDDPTNASPVDPTQDVARSSSVPWPVKRITAVSTIAVTGAGGATCDSRRGTTAVRLTQLPQLELVFADRWRV